jgi:hypothetical protein
MRLIRTIAISLFVLVGDIAKAKVSHIPGTPEPSMLMSWKNRAWKLHAWVRARVSHQASDRFGPQQPSLRGEKTGP